MVVGCGLWVAKLRVTVVGNVAVVAGVAIVAVVRNRRHILVTDGCGLRVAGCGLRSCGLRSLETLQLLQGL
jgi:uncharacterized metal-binding protein